MSRRRISGLDGLDGGLNIIGEYQQKMQLYSSRAKKRGRERSKFKFLRKKRDENVDKQEIRAEEKWEFVRGFVQLPHQQIAFKFNVPPSLLSLYNARTRWTGHCTILEQGGHSIDAVQY